MKKIFLILIIISCGIITLSAQTNNSDRIKIIAQTENNKIKLRWMLTDYAVWAEGNNVGYTVIRYTTHANGVQLPFTEVGDSRIILEDNLLPLPEATWDSFGDNPFAQVAKGTLYADDASVVISGTPSLADAYNQVESNDARYLFGHFAAEQSFAVAKGMALGYKDNNILPNHTYLYQVSLNSTEPSFEGTKAGIVLKSSEFSVFPAISTPYGRGQDKAIMIQWDLIESREYYSTYDIERSTDGSTFEKVNELPFVFAAEGIDEPDVAVYKDEIEDNSITYYYRIIGRTPFGTSGPPSEMVELSGAAPRISINPFLKDYVGDASLVKLVWNEFDAVLQDQIDQINVYRSQYSNKDYVKINTSIIPSGETAFGDENPVNTAYYQLEVIDINGYSYTSPALLVQLDDTAPPAIPVNLSGSFITSSKVELLWDANTEEDLKGYRLFVANRVDAVFTQITSNAVTATTYVYEIDPEFMVDNIYFKILAADNRDNYSEESEAIEIARPDVVPPSKPVLFKVAPTPAGMELGFKFSSSEDRKAHILQFKPAGTPNWEKVVRIKRVQEENYLENLTPNATTSTNYIMPNTEFERRPYQFRLVAGDFDRNFSSSEIITVTPYDSGIRGEIQSFEAHLEMIAGSVESNFVIDLINQILNLYDEEGVIDFEKIMMLHQVGVISDESYQYLTNPNLPPIKAYYTILELKELVAAALAELIPEILLKWLYESTDQLQDFQIFRSAEGSPMMLYKTIPVEEISDNGGYIFLDTDLHLGVRYFYQVMARHAGNAFSPRSETVMVKVE